MDETTKKLSHIGEADAKKRLDGDTFRQFFGPVHDTPKMPISSHSTECRSKFPLKTGRGRRLRGARGIPTFRNFLSSAVVLRSSAFSHADRRQATMLTKPFNASE